MDGTIITQGSFTSTGNAQFIPIRSDVDWMMVTNFTEMTAATGSHGVKYFWQRGLAANNGFVTLRNAGATATNDTTSAALAVPGFTLVDTSAITPGPAIAITGISNVGVVLTGTTAGLSVGTIVRLSNAVGAQQLCGIDLEVTAINPGVSFTVRVPANMVAANAPGAAARYRIVAPSAQFYPNWFPNELVVQGITQAAAAVVSTFSTHFYKVGQEVRLIIPTGTTAGTSMVELNEVQATIIALNSAFSFSINIDTTGFTAFAFPLTADVACTFPQVVPFGEDGTVANSPALNGVSLYDATRNIAQIGMSLGAGITSPAGSLNDVIYWVAGKSFSVNNQ